MMIPMVENTVVYLIRHSTPVHPMKDGRQAMYGPDAPLTAEGKLKAQKLRSMILSREGKPFDIIYSSPFKRAFETAGILAGEAPQNKVIVIEGLRDTDSAWAGTPMDELIQIADAGQLFNDPRTHETILEIVKRMTAAFYQIVGAHPGGLIGIVSHGDPLRILVDRISHPEREIPPYPQLVREFSLGQVQGLRLEIFPGGRMEIGEILKD
jgi:broad specificity phosphatase PhoE